MRPKCVINISKMRPKCVQNASEIRPKWVENTVNMHAEWVSQMRPASVLRVTRQRPERVLNASRARRGRGMVQSTLIRLIDPKLADANWCKLSGRCGNEVLNDCPAACHFNEAPIKWLGLLIPPPTLHRILHYPTLPRWISNGAASEIIKQISLQFLALFFFLILWIPSIGEDVDASEWRQVTNAALPAIKYSSSQRPHHLIHPVQVDWPLQFLLIILILLILHHPCPEDRIVARNPSAEAAFRLHRRHLQFSLITREFMIASIWNLAVLKCNIRRY